MSESSEKSECWDGESCSIRRFFVMLSCSSVCEGLLGVSVCFVGELWCSLTSLCRSESFSLGLGGLGGVACGRPWGGILVPCFGGLDITG